jgi:hypothetical protein
MAKIVGEAKIEVTATFTVSESELRALDALAGYGDDAFLKMFYKDLGENYMKPHEEGLRLFLKSIRGIAGGIIGRADGARRVFNKVS